MNIGAISSLPAYQPPQQAQNTPKPAAQPVLQRAAAMDGDGDNDGSGGGASLGGKLNILA